MLSNTLNTNQIKDASSTEVEFEHLDAVGRTREFKQITESPNLPHRLTISHSETGTGATRVRRSVVRFDKTVAGVSLLPRGIAAYVVLSAPVGDLSATTEMKNVLAELISFMATTGSGTTVLFDCSGNGANALITGGL